MEYESDYESDEHHESSIDPSAIERFCDAGSELCAKGHPTKAMKLSGVLRSKAVANDDGLKDHDMQKAFTAYYKKATLATVIPAETAFDIVKAYLSTGDSIQMHPNFPKQPLTALKLFLNDQGVINFDSEKVATAKEEFEDPEVKKKYEDLHAKEVEKYVDALKKFVNEEDDLKQEHIDFLHDRIETYQKKVGSETASSKKGESSKEGESSKQGKSSKQGESKTASSKQGKLSKQGDSETASSEEGDSETASNKKGASAKQGESKTASGKKGASAKQGDSETASSGEGDSETVSGKKGASAKKGESKASSSKKGESSKQGESKTASGKKGESSKQGESKTASSKKGESSKQGDSETASSEEGESKTVSSKKGASAKKGESSKSANAFEVYKMARKESYNDLDDEARDKKLMKKFEELPDDERHGFESIAEGFDGKH